MKRWRQKCAHQSSSNDGDDDHDDDDDGGGDDDDDYGDNNDDDDYDDDNDNGDDDDVEEEEEKGEDLTTSSLYLPHRYESIRGWTIVTTQVLGQTFSITYAGATVISSGSQTARTLYIYIYMGIIYI